MKIRNLHVKKFMASLLLGFAVCVSVQAQTPKFKNITNVQVGEESAAEIVAYNKNTQTLWVLNDPNSTVDAYDFSNPSKPILKYLFDYSEMGGGATSVAAYGDYVAVAITAEVKQDNGTVVVLDASDASVLKEYEAGALPDMLTFSKDGNYIVVANEGEPNEDYDNDPEGSVTVIDISSGLETATVSTADFTFYNDKQAYLRGIGVRIQDNAGQTVAQDLEPEYIAISADNTTAYVTLQENNAVAKVYLANATVTDILPLGHKDFSKGQPELETFVLNEASNWPSLGTPNYGTETPTVMLGGFSGLCYDQHNSTETVSVFWAVPDRGPNDGPVKGVEGAAGNLRPYKLPSYQARMVKFCLDHTTGVISFDPDDQVLMFAKDGSTPITGKGNVEGMDEVPVTYLDSETGADYTVDGTYYQELTYDPYGGDFEGIIRDADGNFWMCDENRPSIYKFAANGSLIERYVPDGVSSLGTTVQTEGHYGAETLPANYNNRRANRGFEGIAYDEENGIVYGFIQSAMYNPSSAAKSSDVIRILGISASDGTPVSEYIYLLERNANMGTAESAVDKIGDACYVGDGKLVVIERDSKGLGDQGSKKYIYEIDLLGATNLLDEVNTTQDIRDLARLAEGTTLELMTADEIVAAGIQPVYKRKVLNLPSIGYLPSDKAEGLALLPTGQLAVINDNDFGLAGAGQTDNTVLGLISFNDDNKISPSDKVDEITFSHQPVLGTYMPDAIASYNYNGMDYIVIANEGDGREYGDFEDEARIKDLTLNADRFPDAETLQENENIGRLKSTLSPTWDDLDGDGEMDNLFVMGARSFSIYDEFGNQVYDSGSDLTTRTIMNSPQGKEDLLSRSDDKGIEPEALTLGVVDGKTLAFIGLERLNAIAVYDVTNPMDVEFVQYLNDHDYFTGEGNTSPEGFSFISAEDSPTNEPLFIAGYEVSGSVGVYSELDVEENAKFMVIADLHLMAPSLLVNDGEAFQTYLAQDRKMLAESDEILDEMTAKILAESPDYVLVPGDLTKDGAYVSHQGVAAMFATLEANGIEVFVTPGNHDINNSHAVEFDGATTSAVAYTSPSEFTTLYANYGYADADESDANSLSYVEKFDGTTDYWILSIDACHYDNNIADDYPETAGSIKAATLIWIESVLADAETAGKEVIAIMHHGILEHYNYHGDFFADYMVEDWENVSEQLADAGLKVVFTGHSHAQDITKKVTKNGNVITDVQTGSLVTYPSPYRVVEICDNGSLKINGGKLEEVEGVSDDFQDYALTYLNNGFPDLVKYMLMGAPLYISEEVAETLKMPFTRAYFAHYGGDEQFIPSDDQDMIEAMYASGDLGAIQLAAVMQSMWTDLDANDWYTTIDFNEQYNKAWDLTIFHNNDGESKLLGVEDETEGLFGTVAAFKAKLDALRSELENESVTLSSGDNFLAGPQFAVGLENEEGIYDALAMSQIGYDAICLGNHDFDFGPDVLAQFISDFSEETPFLSSNLDFTSEANLQALADEGRIAPYTIIEKGGVQVGVVGATTPSLDYISSPRNTIINDDVAAAIQASVNALTSEGINKIVVISHLQDIEEEKALVASLTNVDVVIAGGGDELLGEEGVETFPGDGDFYDVYPITVQDSEGNNVYVVTTPGEYKYVGKLDLDFDENGVVTAISDESGLYVVKPENDGFNASLRVNAEEPVQDALDEMASNVVANSEVALDGTRTSIRAIETNLGNLVADAMLWQANQLHTDFGVDAADIGLVGGGGIRNNTVIPAGPISELNTFEILPFSNFVAVVENVTPADFKEVLENSVSAMEGGLNSGSGRFLQVAGIDIVWDTEATSIEYDGDGNVINGNTGERIWTATLADGTPIVVDGVVSGTAPNVNIALPDFTARGGDQFNFGTDKSFTTLGVTYQQALYNYLVDGVSGAITAVAYPEDGEDRIVRKDISNTVGELEESENVKVYPVPAVDYINFELKSASSLVVTNMKGAVVLQQSMEAGVNNVNISELASGVYVYTITTENAIYHDIFVIR